MARRDNLVIAHFRDGTLVRGHTLDFFPTKSRFHILSAGGQRHEVDMSALKAIFFVRDLDGNEAHDERKGFFHRQQGKKLMVEFEDGEIIFGYTLSYTTRGLGFFMFPGDPDCNNTKVFVIHSATRRVKLKVAAPPYAPGYAR